MSADAQHKTRTLWLLGMLHVFTHIYNVALLPLYLLMKRDFGFAGEGQATSLVTILMLSYFVPSYWQGILADKLNRKKLLTWGLALNAVSFIALSFAPNYACAVVAVVLAGLGGSFYHPAATAMIARLFPENTGRAFGLVGIGAGLGFCFAPLFSGWRADMLEATRGAAAWREPVLELGILGVLAALTFWWLADEEKPLLVAAGFQPASEPGHPARRNGATPATGVLKSSTAAAATTDFSGRQDAGPLRQAGCLTPPADKLFPAPGLYVLFFAAAFAFGLRDFSGAGMGSLGSLFLQKVHGFDARKAGLALCAMFFASAIGNPLFGRLSDSGRARWTAVVLVLAMLLVALFPHVPAGWTMPVLAAWGFFTLATYPMIEALLMESVPDAVRGRIYGMFITIGGLVGQLSHWIVGDQVRRMGDAAHVAESYFPLYYALAALLLLTLAGLPCLHAIRKREHLESVPALPDAHPIPLQ